MLELPDALVLGAGGTLGEAWMRGWLAGAGLDFTRCEYFVGTSAGSIVAALLAAGRPPEVDETVAPADAVASVQRRLPEIVSTLATPFAPLTLAVSAPAGRLARAALLRAAPRPERNLNRLGRHIDEWGARFDGRLRIAAVDRRSGRRVMFGAPDAPRARVSEAVLASCAVPWIFSPVRIGAREYVDGGVWSTTNLDTAPVSRGAHVLCLVPSAGALRTASLALAGYEALALRARGVTVDIVAPDAPFGANLMDESRRGAVSAAGYVQGRGTRET